MITIPHHHHHPRCKPPTQPPVTTSHHTIIMILIITNILYTIIMIDLNNSITITILGSNPRRGHRLPHHQRGKRVLR